MSLLIDCKNFIFGNASQAGGGVISGVVDTYAELPTPASDYDGQFYAVRDGSQGALSFLNIYKYPAGIYSPNSSDVWELTPLNVKVAEDSLTLVNITNWAEWVAYAFDISAGDRIIYDGVTYTNLTGSQTSTAPDTDTTNWTSQIYENIIHIAKTGAQFSTIEDAFASITDNSTSNRYCLLVAPTIYTIDNSSGPVALKDFVSIRSCGVRSTIFQPSDPTQDMFSGANFAYIAGIVFSGTTSGWVLNHTAANSNVNINDCVLRDCGHGFLLNGATSVLEIRRLVVNNPAASTTTYAVKIESGSFVFKDLIARSTSRITTFLDISGSNTVGKMTDITTNSSNVTTALRMYDGCLISGSVLNLNVPYDGIVIYGNNISVSLNTVTIQNALNDGFRIDNTGTNISFSLFATVITGSSNLNFNILNANCVVLGNGVTELDKSYIVPGAELYAYLFDIKEADEALHVLGELHVGTPGRPNESCYGGGDSYTTGMLVYTSTAGGIFTDVSTAAASPSGSTFTFPGTAVNNAIYVASSLSDGSDVLLHHGIKCSISTAGVLGTGNIISEYWNGAAWVEINGMITDSDEPFLPYAKDYFSRTGGFQLRYDIVRMNDGTWVKNDPISPVLGTSYYWVRYRISSAITTAPIFKQFKIHPPRSEFNADGFLEFFGDARPYAQLSITVGTGKPIQGNMQNQTIWFDENIGIGHATNKFTAQNDIYGWEIIAPNNIDTSSELAFRWCGLPDTSETITWTVRWAWQTPDGTIYTSEPAGGSNPTSQSTTTSKAVTANTLEWFDAYLDISDLLPRRDANYPDQLIVTIQPSTMGGTFSMLGVQAYYLIWSGGGHAD